MNTSIFSKHNLFWVSFLLFFLALKMRPDSLFINLTYLWVNETSAQGYEAVKDQRTGWQQMARFFYQTYEFRSEADATATIPGLLQGIHAFREARWGDAAYWFSIASNNTDQQVLPSRFTISPWVKITPDQALVLDGSSYRWAVRSDSATGASVIPDGDSFGVFTCDENTVANKRASFYWSQPLQISYHHTVLLEITVSAGTTLIFETVIDGDIIRHLALSGGGKQESYTLQLEGDQIDLFYILLFSNPDSSKRCQAEIHTITFLLDEEFK